MARLLNESIQPAWSACEERGVKDADGKIQKEQDQTEAQPDGAWGATEQTGKMASLENRSVSNLIEVMADERWERLAEQQGVAYAKTVAEAMNLKLDMDNPVDREKLRRAILGLVAGRKMPKQEGASLSRWLLFPSPDEFPNSILGPPLSFR
jgi:hypothetical protein